MIEQEIPRHVLELYLRTRSIALEQKDTWHSALRIYPDKWRAQFEMAEWKRRWNKTASLRQTFTRLAAACDAEGTTMAEMKRQALQMESASTRKAVQA